jgi:hypothetical protein
MEGGFCILDRLLGYEGYIGTVVVNDDSFLFWAAILVGLVALSSPHEERNTPISITLIITRRYNFSLMDDLLL